VRRLFQPFHFLPVQSIWAVLCDLAQSHVELIRGSLNMEGHPRRSDTAQTEVERLDRETNVGIGFGGHDLQGVEKLPALAVEESMAVKLAMVATAPPNRSLSGRMMATWGRLGLMNSQGTGKIRLG
jgi:hypothetical protein